MWFFYWSEVNPFIAHSWVSSQLAISNLTYIFGCWLGHWDTYFSSSNRRAQAHSQGGGHRISKASKRGKAPDVQML